MCSLTAEVALVSRRMCSLAIECVLLLQKWRKSRVVFLPCPMCPAPMCSAYEHLRPSEYPRPSEYLGLLKIVGLVHILDLVLS